MKRFVIGDIHGRIEALKKVLKKSKFNYAKDKLIVLGDVADGGYNTAQVIDELLKIDNLIYIIGNHDEWFINHLSTGWAEEIWIQQGGGNTLTSYGAKVKESQFVGRQSKINTSGMNVPCTHQEFFNNGIYYYEEDNMLFVHGGIDPNKTLKEQNKHTLLWDRDLIGYARNGNNVKKYDRVFIGHTTTEHLGAFPIRYKNLIMMDCGAGWKGRLCIMDIDTEEHWLSEFQKPAIK